MVYLMVVDVILLMFLVSFLWKIFCKPERPPVELWVGTYEQALFYAQQQEIGNPTIVSKLQDLVGYNCNLRVNLCGQYDKLPDWERIKIQLDYIERCGNVVKIVEYLAIIK